jgi:hypothetical protein
MDLDELRIDGPNGDTHPSSEFPTWIRQLWLGETVPAPVRARKSRPTTGDIAKTPKPKTVPTTIPQGVIKIGVPDPAKHTQEPPKTWTNGTTIIPRAPLKVKVDISRPFLNSRDHQFRLLVHPAYRPPPPIPTHDEEAGFTKDVFSPLDYLPPRTNALYDVIFAVRRIKNSRTDKTLKSLTIEIPVADAKAAATADPKDPAMFNRFTEPLLDSTDYSNVGIAMCSNSRFVPTLFSGTASTTGDPSWDGRPILGITLVPRSGLPSGAMALLDDGKAMEASVRLSEARVLDIINPKGAALVAHFDGSQPTNPTEVRGRSMIRMTERYGDDKRDEFQVSWCVALKKAPKEGEVERDLLRNPV